MKKINQKKSVEELIVANVYLIIALELMNKNRIIAEYLFGLSANLIEIKNKSQN